MKLPSLQTGASYSKVLEGGAATALLAYPALMIAVKGGMNAAFLILLLLSLAAWLLQRWNLPAVSWDSQSFVYLAAMAALPAAILLSQLGHQQFSVRSYDAASRFLLAVPVFLLLRRLRFDVVAVIQYAFPLGAIIGLIAGSLDITEAYRRMRTSFLDAIHFGDFELILAFLSLCSIDWLRRDSRAVRLLKIAGFLSGLYACYASGTRGAWMTLPLLLGIAYHYNVLAISKRMFVLSLAALFLVVASAYHFSAQMRFAVNEPFRNLVEYGRGNLDTDNGVRLQLYKAALQVFAENPVFGVGPDGFREEVTKMERSGQLTAIAAAVGRGEVHNEVLSRAVSSGIPGLVAILAIYFVPLWIFLRYTRSASVHASRAGVMGVGFVSGFVVFGLTTDILNLTMAAAFYGFTVAVLLAACMNIHHGGHPSAQPTNL